MNWSEWNWTSLSHSFILYIIILYTKHTDPRWDTSPWPWKYEATLITTTPPYCWAGLNVCSFRKAGYVSLWDTLSMYAFLKCILNQSSTCAWSFLSKTQGHYISLFVCTHGSTGDLPLPLTVCVHGCVPCLSSWHPRSHTCLSMWLRISQKLAMTACGSLKVKADRHIACEPWLRLQASLTMKEMS